MLPVLSSLVLLAVAAALVWRSARSVESAATAAGRIDTGRTIAAADSLEESARRLSGVLAARRRDRVGPVDR